MNNYRQRGTQGQYNPGTDSSSPGGSLQSGEAAITNGAESVAVTFPTAFSAAPVVVVNVMTPSGGYVISATVDSSTITTSGFTALLGAAVPTGTYKLAWTASLPS